MTAWFDRSTGVLSFTHTRSPDAFNAIIGSQVPFTSGARFGVFRGRSFDDDSENLEHGKAALMVTSSIGHGDALVDVGVPCTVEQDDKIESHKWTGHASPPFDTALSPDNRLHELSWACHPKPAGASLVLP